MNNSLRRKTILILYITFVSILGFSQDNYNLGEAQSSRFDVTDRVWPENIGEADVCMWKDDKLSAFTITIDDNAEGDIDFWISMNEKYGFNFTWFVITEAIDAYNVKDWNKFQKLVNLGSEVSGHDDRNWYKNVPAGKSNPTDEEYYARLDTTIQKIKANISEGDNEVFTYAYPFGEGNFDEAVKLFTAMRGTLGVLNQADKVNYLDVNSVSNPHIFKDETSRDLFILPLVTKTSTLYGSNYYRGWGSTHFHSLHGTEDQAEALVKYLSEKGDSIWVDTFTKVAHYSQSFATNNLVIDNIEGSVIKFTLTDQMVDSAFNQALSVKVRVSNTWVNATAIQNGVNRNVKLISNGGKKYALVDAVPDAGQVILTGEEDSDPAVLTQISDQELTEGNFLIIDFSANTNAEDDIALSVENLPKFATFKNNNDNTASITFAPEAFSKGEYSIIVIADNGRSETSLEFNVTVIDDGATLYVESDLKDASAYFPVHNYVDSYNRTAMIAGGGYIEGKQMSAVIPFQLPEIPRGKEISDVKFSINLESKSSTSLITGDLDLYGIDARFTSMVLTSDAYAGEFDKDGNAHGLQSNFANSNSLIGKISTSADGEQKMIDFIKSQYTNNNQGKYIFIRISTNDINQARDGKFSFSSADGSASDENVSAPKLIIKYADKVQEPIVIDGALNLEPTTTSRFEVSDRVWPEEMGVADVCLWNDDKLSAFTITIDDNAEGDLDFWQSMQKKYGVHFTWFVITEAEERYNVKNWEKYRTLVEGGSQVDGHDDRNWYKKPSEELVNPTDAEYNSRLKATQDKIRKEIDFGDNKSWSYAYPYGEGNLDVAKGKFIAMRGTLGVLNHADKVNYLDVNSVSNPHVYENESTRNKFILPLVTKTGTLYGSNYYRGWGSTHFHTLEGNEETTEAFIKYLSDKGDSLWVDSFTRVAQYSQSYATNNVTVDFTENNKIGFTLTDMMADAAFDQELSVKFRVSNTWVSATAIQNGVSRKIRLTSHKGKRYIIVQAVPDAGQVVIQGEEDSDPAVFETIDDVEIIEGSIATVNLSATTNAEDKIKFTADNLPSFATFVDNGDNTASILFSPEAFTKGDYTISVVADNGRSQILEEFIITIADDGSAFYINADDKDASAYYTEHNFVDMNNRNSMISGGGFIDGKQLSAVIPFQLPEIPEGKVIVDVKFSINLENKSDLNLITGDFDLYGIDARPSNMVVVSDGYAGEYGKDNNADALQKNFAKSSTAVGNVSTNAEGDRNIIAFINKQYANNQQGNFVFIRISTDDVNQEQYGRMYFTSANGSVANNMPAPKLIVKYGDAPIKIEGNLNLDPTTTPRFEVTDRVWPTTVGEGDVCMWYDDRLAAFTVTIDDNAEEDLDFWKSMQEEYGINFTWFVITEANPAYNVKDWSKYKELVEGGSQIDGHDDRNWYKNPTEQIPNLSAAEYAIRLKATAEKIRKEINVGDNNAWSYAYPFGEGNIEEAKQQFIAMRGTLGLLNKADMVNYYDINSVSNPHIYIDEAARDKFILPLVTKISTLYGSNYYRGWGSTHFHSLHGTESTTEAFIKYLSDKGDSLWVDTFTRVAQYSQSFATNSLTVDYTKKDEIGFTLSDDMADVAFYQALSVKFRVSNTWLGATAFQDGVERKVRLTNNNGKRYVIVDAIPDGGQVIIYGEEDKDPAVFTTVEDQDILEDDVTSISLEASTDIEDFIAFTIEDLPSFATLVDNNDNTASLVIAPKAFDKGEYNIIVMADNGRSQTMEEFKITVADDGSTMYILADNKDASAYYVEHNYTDAFNRTAMISGGGYINGKQLSAVMPFLLPEIPEGKVIVDAKFVINLENKSETSLITGNVDLYAIEARYRSLVEVQDGYAGTYGEDETAYALQSNFANANTAIGTIEANDEGVDNIVDFMNYEYENGKAGNYVFIRISTDDINQSQYGRMYFTSADGAAENNLPHPTLVLKYGDADEIQGTDNDLVYEAGVSNDLIDTDDITRPDYEEDCIDCGDHKSIKINPNVIKSNKINFKVGKTHLNKEFTLTLLSTHGSLIEQQTVRMNNKKHTLYFDSLFNLKGGAYLVLVEAEGVKKVIRIIKK
ncbi:MAG: polysaccharide deacetylase family protein [Flavobacteriales bacterium]|nr:polysaccharide deacetylase family protein [Flavobacteriales bacterium]